jgi:sulfatase maturation enzyme AslB (radical SAM superfamily)
MSNQKIFCNVPWTNLHVYWDGSYGVCCSERQAPHTEPEKYNLKTTSIVDWYNSVPMTQVREQIKGDAALPMCASCYKEEANGYESRRIKENFKTVIFTEQAFQRSYKQSTYIKDFETSDNTTTRLPIDWHVDFGNECNFACKMCNPRASSKISAQYVKWGLQDSSSNSNWTLNDASWENFKQSVLLVKDLNRIHFMGGEPLLNKKFRPLLEFLLENKPNLSVSFVNNGSLITDDLIEILKKFKSCDVEVSLESISKNNEYIRQGADTALILANIQKLKQAESDTFKVVLRSVPQLLNVNNYDEYIKYAWDNQISIQGIPLTNPRYLQISVLPISIRDSLKPKYQELRDSFSDRQEFTTIITGRNVSGLAQQLRRECDAIIAMLSAPEPTNIVELQQELSQWLIRWDREYKLDAKLYYPEYCEFLESIGYNV